MPNDWSTWAGPALVALGALFGGMAAAAWITGRMRRHVTAAEAEKVSAEAEKLRTEGFTSLIGVTGDLGAELTKRFREVWERMQLLEASLDDERAKRRRAEDHVEKCDREVAELQAWKAEVTPLIERALIRRPPGAMTRSTDPPQGAAP